MSPASWAGILAGSFFAAGVVIAVYFNWQERQEAEAARRAKAYYAGWKDRIPDTANLLPSASSDVFDHDAIRAATTPKRWDDDASRYDKEVR